MKITVEKPTLEHLQKLNVFSWPIWECDPSSFDWHYEERETCYILEGKVTVETDSGNAFLKKETWLLFRKACLVNGLFMKKYANIIISVDNSKVRSVIISPLK